MVSDTPSAKWKGLEQFTRVLEPVSNLFGPIKETVDLFMECVDKYEMTGVAKIEYEALRVRLEELFEDLNGYFGKGCSLTMTSSMENLCRSIQAELDYIKKQQDRNIGERYLSAADESEKVLACYRRIEGHLQRLSLNANLSIWRVAQVQAANSQTDRMLSFVDRLPSSLPALYDSAEGIELKRRQCTPGTRVNVLANVLDWTRSAGGGVYWLNGMAGTGKTTIAYSKRQFNHSVDRVPAGSLLSSVSVSLVRNSREGPGCARKATTYAVRCTHCKAHARGAAYASSRANSRIDALDECEQKESTARMLDVLLSKSASLPVKFIVSSRPESQIHDQMASERTRSRLVLHELDKGEVQADIEKYLRESLARMHPSEAQIAALVERAGILFIYAATAVRYIGYDSFHRNPSARLRTILERPQGRITTQSTEVDQLYGTILEAALGDAGLDEADRADMKRVLYTVICAREPLTVGGISELLQINDPDCVRAALRPLWSVVHVVVGSELVTTLHASFPDFMFDPTRSKAYHCDSGAHSRMFAEHCLKRITLTKPEFNICGLESSYLPDRMVPHIHERVANVIPSDLLYACRYWADHVEAGNCASTLAAQLRDFLSRRLLIWMEVLNLHKQMSTGASCMKRVIEWCNQFESDEELIKLASDALRFVETFASNPVSQSTPHIYLSMLTFWPKSGPMAKHYSQFTHGPVEAGGTALDQRQPAYLAAWRYAGDIRSIAMSQDGKHIALGFDDHVLVVDSSGGQLILGPLHGLSGSIDTVMFSPEQTRVFACSSDYHSRTATIVGWDTRTGATAVGPLQFDGRMGSTNITFWPDRTCVASCFDDHNIFLWDAESRKMLRSLETHALVQTVAFSPDGIFIAAGLNQALQVWNSQTGGATLGPISTGGVNKIAFSPDGSRIAHNQRSSDIDTLYVRDAQNGQLIHELNIGIKDIITSIMYSHDGRYIVSGCREIVMLWDAQSGNMVLGPLEGHTDEIDAVTFSPDGSRIISACTGGLVCTWGTQHHDIAPSSISARSTGILSAMFSPYGQHFVSGSEDGSLYIRDSHTGAMTVGPIRAHTAGVVGVEYSKDYVISGFGDGVIMACSARSGEVLRSLTVAPEHEIGSIAFSPNGKFIATGSRFNSSSEVNMWDAQTGIRARSLFTFTDPNEFVPSVLFSPDGTRIVASSWSDHCPIIVLDVSNGRNLFGRLDGHTSFVSAASYSPDGALIASGSTDNTVILWDAYTGSKLLGPLVGHSDRVDSVSFSPDSTRLISGSDDGTIRIWDVKTGATLLELPHGHEQVISSVAYSPDGTRILTLSWDRSVRIHDARSAEERALSHSTTEFGDWVMNKDGWLVDDQSRLLVWVPGDLRRALMWPRTQVAVAPWGYVRVKFDKSRMGESWVKGYTL
ncbi:unnamed protein product [Rhizoctonia solani]|uniref:Vegetative incompatibility protein HET-E-1 n=1 Tax=Rhizoctonia solani TaxID=456999 RepID=A0A8H3HJS6_9AGAM|nr:unnamed protein product [Rhizoctonia solani]